MAIYNTKYVLTYCNKNNIPLRIEIQQRDYTGESYILVNNAQYLQDNEGNFIVVKRDSYNPDRDKSKIEGSSNPFSLEYRNDSDGKLCNIMATSANLSFWSDDNFNIDELKTSDETELKINFYLDDVLQWTGFVVPDFFTEEIGTISEINLTASDRIAILKDIEYDVSVYSYDNVSLMYIINECLKKTGLILPYEVILDVVCDEWSGTSVSGNPLSRTFVNERRFVESESKNMNCYDILQKIMKQFNCRLVQRLGKWNIANKEQLESGNGDVIHLNSDLSFDKRVKLSQQGIFFDYILTGGQRTIIPVGSTTTYNLELGENQVYPFNNNFIQDDSIQTVPSNWKSNNGYIASITNIIPYDFLPTGAYNTTYEDSINHLTNPYGVYIIASSPPSVDDFPQGIDDLSYKNLESDKFNISSINYKKTSFDVTINAIGKPYSSISMLLIIEFDDPVNKYFGLRKNGIFYKFPNNNIDTGLSLNGINFMFEDLYNNVDTAVEQEFKISCSMSTSDQSIFPELDFNNAKMFIRIYPNVTYMQGNTDVVSPSVIKEIKVEFKLDNKTPKATTYQAQIDSLAFTKKYESQDVMFGDYETSGQNGYFYQYRDDSLSIMYAADGTKTKNWSTISDENKRPLLMHSTRQLAKAFGRANDELNITFSKDYLDPIGQYAVGCFSKKYIGVNSKILANNDNDKIVARVIKLINNKSYILSSGTIDYMRCECSVVLSQVQNKEVELIEYIYSNF